MVRIEQETDIERLRLVALLQQRELELVRRRIQHLSLALAQASGKEPDERLQAEMVGLAAAVNAPSRVDGNQSERRKPSDREAVDDGRAAPAEPSRKDVPRKRTGPDPQVNLFRESVSCVLDEADRLCPQCGGELVAIDGLFETREEVDFVEVQYVLRTIELQKYRCACSDCQRIETALPPERPKLPGSRYTLAFDIQVVLNKYKWHLPLARQVRMAALAGLSVTSQTLWGRVWALAKLLEPTWHELQKRVLAEAVVGGDETRWRLLNGSLAKPTVIALTSDAGFFYTIRDDKSAKTISDVLGDFRGWLVADGGSNYAAVHDTRRELHEQAPQRAPPPFRLSGCWFHARRYYIKAAKDFPEAERMLDLIAMVFRIVEGGEQAAIDDHTRRVWLQTVLDEMRRWMLENGRWLPGSKLAEAVGYMDRQWARLTVFVDHRQVWLTNNRTERALRTPVVGRRNHYGSRSARGMKAAAIHYSLVETCVFLGVDPRRYYAEATTYLLANPGGVFLPHQLLPGDSTPR